MSTTSIYEFNESSDSIFNKIHHFVIQRYKIYFNEISLSYEIAPINKPENKEAVNEHSLIVILNQSDIRVNRDKIVTYLKSDLIERYNPIKHYFSKLPKWDGRDYIKQYCSYAKTDDDELYYYHMKKWAVRSIRCVMSKEHINKQCIILGNGDQNAGKSTYLKKLCPKVLEQYYSEHLTFDKDGRIKLCKNFIINLDELQNCTRQNIDTVKALISQQTVNDRLPFDSKNTFLHRICNFVGSTNKTEILVDETGNVRWLVFEVIGAINYERYNKEFNVDNFWAEAYHIYLNEPDFKAELSLEDVKANERRNDRFMSLSAECEAVLKYYEPSDDLIHFRTPTEVVSELSLTGIKLYSNKIGSAFKKYEFKRVKHPQKQVWGYQAKPLFNNPPIKF